MANTVQITFDAADPDALARFWAEVVGYVLQPPPEGYESWDAFLDEIGVPPDERDAASAIVDPDGDGPRFFFQKVPEGKSAKNRVHLDVNLGGGHSTPIEERMERIDAEAERLIGLGAEHVQRFHLPDRNEYWIVMRDPEGNEFCLQ